MNTYLAKNLEAIKEKHPEIKINQELVESIEKQDNPIEMDSYNGFMLKSNVDQSIAIDVWCEQFEGLMHNEVAIVFGVGSLDYYVALRDKYPTLVIIVYEPCEEIFYKSLLNDDYVRLLSGKDLYFSMGKNILDSFMHAAGKVLGYESVHKPFFATIPNYHKIFEKEYEEFKKAITDSIESNMVSRNTIIYFEEKRLNNYLDNLTKLVNESVIFDLSNKFKELNLQNYPAIILSAGPSLDKNIKRIKDIKGRAFVIAVDAAVNTATKNNIRPDMIISVDPDMYEDSLRDEVGRELPLVIHMYGSMPLRDVNRGRKFYVTDTDYYIDKVLEQCGKKVGQLATGGSVANSAFSLAKMMGFNTIIFMGQDLGFPGNKQHAEDAFDDEEDASEEDTLNFYVESVDGGKVLTSVQMDIYRKWFEIEIEIFKDLHVVDATEGGALIKGTEVMTIEEAIEKYCPEEEKDFETLIDSTEYLLNDQNKEEIKAIINKTFEDIDYNIDYFEKAKRDYYKLRDINEKRKYNTTEFKRIVDKVGEHNKYVEDNKDFILYKKCCTEKYFECLDELKTVYDNEYDEIKKLASQGLIMLDEYARAGNILKEKWNKLTDGKGI